jgi:hypothetical protein
MRWFGPYRGAPFCDDGEHVPTPIGTPCLWCKEPIADGDGGDVMPFLAESGEVTQQPRHLECAIRSAAGGVFHQLGQCLCCGGDKDPDPPDMTPREAARAAARVAGLWPWRRV